MSRRALAALVAVFGIASALVAPAGAGVAGVGLLGADGSLALVSGTVTCGGAASIELRMILMQDDAHAIGQTVRKCKQNSASFSLLLATSEGSLAVGSAMACFEADSAKSARRVVTGCRYLRLVDALLGP